MFCDLNRFDLSTSQWSGTGECSRASLEVDHVPALRVVRQSHSQHRGTRAGCPSHDMRGRVSRGRRTRGWVDTRGRGRRRDLRERAGGNIFSVGYGVGIGNC